MAVTDGVQGLGIGRKLMEHCIKAAEENNRKIIIYSQQKTGSCHFFVWKFGFEEIPLEEGVYERTDIKMEKLI
jgi:ribosomal protein S18 acetylase RimI-like enzyme